MSSIRERIQACYEEILRLLPAGRREQLVSALADREGYFQHRNELELNGDEPPPDTASARARWVAARWTEQLAAECRRIAIDRAVAEARAAIAVNVTHDMPFESEIS